MPIDSPRAVLGPPAEDDPGRGTGRSKVRGTLAQRIALVTIMVALLTAIIVAAVSVPQIRAAGMAEARQNLSRTADALAFALPPTPEVPQLANNAEWIVVPAVGPQPVFVDDSMITELRRTGRVSRSDAGGLLVEGRYVDGYALYASEPRSVVAAGVARDVSRLLVALAVGVGIAAVSGVLLARRLARPLRRAAEAAEEMAAGARDVQVEPEGPIEVAEVAEALNGLNAALTVSEERQREFLLSVSHELRTPLTSIRGYAEAFADGIVEPDQAPATGALMVSEADRLERLVADLLDLARMGAREVRIDAVQTDIAPTLAEAAAVWSDRCRPEGVVLVAELPAEPVRLVTDPGRVRQMVDNLMANALRITPPGQPIVLALRGQDGSVDIEVRDGGPGLTDDDLAVAFEPAELYSRYRGLRPVGSGVGLALVGRLAERMGGRAVAGHAPEGGAAFTITLPVGGPQRG